MIFYHGDCSSDGERKVWSVMFHRGFQNSIFGSTSGAAYEGYECEDCQGDRDERDNQSQWHGFR